MPNIYRDSGDIFQISYSFFHEVLTFSSNSALALQPLKCIHCNTHIFELVRTPIVHSLLFSKSLLTERSDKKKINKYIHVSLSTLGFVHEEMVAYVHLFKGIINIGCRFEKLLCEHVDIPLSDIMGHFVFGSLTLLLQFSFSRQWLWGQNHLIFIKRVKHF